MEIKSLTEEQKSKIVKIMDKVSEIFDEIEIYEKGMEYNQLSIYLTEILLWSQQIIIKNIIAGRDTIND